MKTLTIQDGDSTVGEVAVEDNTVSVESSPTDQLQRQLEAQDGLTTYRGVEPVERENESTFSEASHSDKRDPVTENELVGYLEVLIQRAGFDVTAA